MARKSSGIATAGLLVIAILLGVLVWQPLNDEVTLLENDLETKQGTLATLEAELADFVSLEANLPVADSERARILARVPDSLNQSQLITDFSAIAQEQGISLAAMTYSLQENKEGANIVSMVGTFSGDYANLVALLQALEGNERLFRVASIGVQLSDVTDDGIQQMNFSVTVEAYYQ